MTMPASPQNSSHLFDGRYEPIVKLGGGAFGEVWRALDTTTGRTVALKLINPNRTTSQMAWEEATRLTLLESPHLVRVHGATLAVDIPYIDMELAARGSTAQRVTPYGIDAGTAVRWAQQVSRGLQLCHARQIVHRDIKPENVLLSQTDQALLGDFGAAAIMRADGTSDEHGDIHIRAPEAFGGYCTALGDIYSLGATLYHFLTGRYPHTFSDHGSDFEAFSTAVRQLAPDIRDVAPHVSRTLATAVRGALAIDPAARIPTASEFDRSMARVHATRRVARRVDPHDPLGRCWDVVSATVGSGSAIHVCAAPKGAMTEILAYRAGSGRRLREHCQSVPSAKLATRLRATFDALCQ